MSSAGSATVTDETIIYKDPNGCSSFIITCLTESSNRVLVSLPGLHDSGDFMPVEKGQSVIFRLSNLGIRKVIVKGDSGETNINYGVCSKSFGNSQG